MNDPKDDLGPQIDKLERILEKLPKYIPQNSVSSASFNISGGGLVNTVVMVIILAMASAMVSIFISDRNAAAQERAALIEQARSDRNDMRAQARVDVQRIEAEIKDLGQKQETQQAYINEVYRSLKSK